MKRKTESKMKSKNLFYIIIVGLLALLVLGSGCSSTGGLGITIPANVTATQVYSKSLAHFDSDGKKTKEKKVFKVQVGGENDIEDMEFEGDMSKGSFKLKAKKWNSKKKDLIKAQGAREKGNLDAFGIAVKDALGTIPGE